LDLNKVLFNLIINQINLKNKFVFVTLLQTNKHLNHSFN